MADEVDAESQGIERAEGHARARGGAKAWGSAAAVGDEGGPFELRPGALKLGPAP